MDIFLIRHGEVDGPAALYGITDIASTTLGKTKVLEQLTCLNRAAPIDAIWSSPRRRCCEPATRFSESHQIPLNVSPVLAEIDFGLWDGIAFDAFDTEFADNPDQAWPHLTRYYQDPLAISPPKGEPLANFTQRVEAAFTALIKEAQTHHRNRIVVICHGGVIRALIAKILGIPLSGELFSRLQVDYASLHQLRLTPTSEAASVFEQCRIVTINSTLKV